MKKLSLLFLCLLCVSLSAQENQKIAYNSPLDFSILMCGNFAELRANHFHGGLDIKTRGAVNKPVYAIGDGFIKRVSVSPTGYGNALYIEYPNGYTSVYGHLNSFLPAIAARVEAYQYEHQVFPLNLYFDETEFPVKKGQLVAHSGSTGYSFGPHLHFELRKNGTDVLIDPLLFFKNKIKDTRAPKVKAIAIYPRETGVVNNSDKTLVIRPNVSKKNEPIKAWGEIGLGLEAYDYMNDVHNKYGIHSLSLTVDGKEIYSHLLDSIHLTQNRTINAWVDQSLRAKGYWIMRCFKLPGNDLPFLKTTAQRGLFTIDEERPYSVVFTLKDAFGNSEVYRCTIQGKKQQVQHKRAANAVYLPWDKKNAIHMDGFAMVLPEKTLYDNAWIVPEIRVDATGDTIYHISDAPVMLGSSKLLALRIPAAWRSQVDKCYIARVNKKGKKSSCGGKEWQGWLTTRVGSLTSFSVARDLNAPRITAIQPNKWSKRNKLVFKLSDRETGISSYSGQIDGKFYLFSYSYKTRLLTAKLSSKRLKRNSKHKYEITVVDGRGNKTVKSGLFRW